jgi:hypothetical protein
MCVLSKQPTSCVTRPLRYFGFAIAAVYRAPNINQRVVSSDARANTIAAAVEARVVQESLAGNSFAVGDKTAARDACVTVPRLHIPTQCPAELLRLTVGSGPHQLLSAVSIYQ